MRSVRRPSNSEQSGERAAHSALDVGSVPVTVSACACELRWRLPYVYSGVALIDRRALRHRVLVAAAARTAAAATDAAAEDGAYHVGRAVLVEGIVPDEAAWRVFMIVAAGRHFGQNHPLELHEP